MNITDWWENKLPILEQIKIGACTFDVQCMLIENGGYKFILGRGNGQPRIWYKSKSESCWRAFTGFRSGGGIQKGDEYNEDYRGSGYVFECMVIPKLDEKFDNIFTIAEKQNEIKTLPKLYKEIISYKLNNSNLFKYLVAEDEQEEQVEQAKVALDYSLEVKLSRPMKDANDLPKQGYNFSQIGNVEIQTDYRGELLGAVYLKDYYNLFSAALRAVHVDHRRSHHDALDDDIDIDTYQFKYANKMYCYEIAATINSRPHYYTKNNQRLKVDAKVVWVRTLYQLDNNEVSSFGNYKVIPIEMAGLVQKPCDYHDQVADVYNTEIKEQGRVGKKYVLLSVINEISSPIVQQYKIIHNEPLLSGNSEPMIDGIKFTYTTHPSIELRQLNRPFLLSEENIFKQPVIQQQPLNINLGNQLQQVQVHSRLPLIVNVDYDGMTNILKNAVIEGVRRYIDLWKIPKADKKETLEYGIDPKKLKLGHHGGTGLRRAAELMRCVTQAKNLKEVDNYLISCFKDNNIGNEKHTFRAIKSEPYSLFTLVNLSLLHVLKSFKFDWQYNGNLKYIPLIHALYSYFSEGDIQATPNKFVSCVEPVSSEYLDLVKKIDTKNTPVQELVRKTKKIVYKLD
ncbi:hypothetical protein SD28_04280 [Allofrancisella guangzhouensis]|uniref:Uncharacterized protein n=5 Tax=Allofrancisella guangzhouensis TaxID=594679 RepID=A0A0A8E5M6_9GAMM|nr:hypothetical protein SD28_04280 [Allofrancisella guangzhouensis]